MPIGLTSFHMKHLNNRGNLSIATPLTRYFFLWHYNSTYTSYSQQYYMYKKTIIFLRSCDLHALKRLDDMYLHNGPADYYYHRLRKSIKIVLMGCDHSFENCFCVSMGTNQSSNYDMSIDRQADGIHDCFASVYPGAGENAL